MPIVAKGGGKGRITPKSQPESANSDSGESTPSPLDMAKKKDPLCTWIFFHPENPQGNYLNKEIIINIDGGKKQIAINNGLVRTKNKKIADHLQKSGYELIEKIEDNQNVR